MLKLRYLRSCFHKSTRIASKPQATQEADKFDFPILLPRRLLSQLPLIEKTTKKEGRPEHKVKSPASNPEDGPSPATQPAKRAKSKNIPYSTRDSRLVTHDNTNLAVGWLSLGERTGSRVLIRLWPYVLETAPESYINLQNRRRKAGSRNLQVLRFKSTGNVK